MKNSDDMITDIADSSQVSEPQSCASDNAPVGETADAQEPRVGSSVLFGSEHKQEKEQDKNGGESDGAVAALIGVALRSVGLALSFLAIIVCILALSLPLQSMRIFNDLGMSARAIDFGERYIARELRNNGAQKTDAKGNYKTLTKTPGLTNDDMIEALYVTTELSYRLMEEYAAAGDGEMTKYYAARVEKYTRMYSSLNEVSRVNEQKSQANVNKVPMKMMRPAVYSYAHGIRAMNYRARVYLGKTDLMLFRGSVGGDFITETVAQANTFRGRKPGELSRTQLISALDDFVDYVALLGEYLDVEFKRAGVESDLSKKGKVERNGEVFEVSVLSEMFVSNNYKNKISKERFALFFNPNYTAASGGADRTDVFSSVYLYLDSNGIAGFTDYAQAAVDFVPGAGAGDRADEQLHRLYWLYNLNKVSRQLWYMELLLENSRENFGTRSDVIHGEYFRGYNEQGLLKPGMCQSYTLINDGTRFLNEYYVEALSDYLQNFQTN